MGRNEALQAAPGLVAEIQAALLERQGLLRGLGPSIARDRMNTLDMRLTALMDELVALQPPAAVPK